MESGGATDRRVTERSITARLDAPIWNAILTASNLLIGRVRRASGNLEPVWALATRLTPCREILPLAAKNGHVLHYSDFRRILPVN